jgi:hypothetical protein
MRRKFPSETRPASNSSSTTSASPFQDTKCNADRPPWSLSSRPISALIKSQGKFHCCWRATGSIKMKDVTTQEVLPYRISTAQNSPQYIFAAFRCCIEKTCYAAFVLDVWIDTVRQKKFHNLKLTRTSRSM